MKRLLNYAVLMVVATGVFNSQTVWALDWRKLGGTSVEASLASPATGPVSQVWFSADGDRLYARTGIGKVFETVDFENWTLAPDASPRAIPRQETIAERLPESGAVLRASPGSPKIFALGTDLYVSEDSGKHWTNLTTGGDSPVLGSRQRDVSVSPRDSQQIVVANDRGVWRSMDGGFSWTGLNQGLPNLMVREILATPRRGDGAKLSIDGFGQVQLMPQKGPTKTVWAVVSSPDNAADADRDRFQHSLGSPPTAIKRTGDLVYAGDRDGRLWVSNDAGSKWALSQKPISSGAVQRLEVDAEMPRIALAVLSGQTGARLLRTVNAGLTYDDVSGGLPETELHGAAMDRADGAVYVATDRGVFLSHMDLNVSGSAGPWSLISQGLPADPAEDVKLDAAGNQLYVAVQGFGLYAAPAPHKNDVLRVVNAADLSQRAAAPGSLLSVLGGKVRSARAADLAFPVLAAATGASQIQVPFEASGSRISLSLEMTGGRASIGLSLKNVSPAILVDRDGAPMLLDGETGLMLDAGNTAKSRARIQILLTGLGKVKPSWPTGVAAPLDNPPSVAVPVQVMLDGSPVEVTRATLAPGYVGLYIVEIQLPALVNSGPAEFYVAADGQESNHVRMYLESDR